MCLPAAGAAFVDRHVAHVAHKVSYLQLKRLVEEARTRFDPAEAEKRARDAADGRHVSIHTQDVGVNGTVALTGTLDLRDALDLDDALNRGARQRKSIGQLAQAQSPGLPLEFPQYPRRPRDHLNALSFRHGRDL